MNPPSSSVTGAAFAGAGVPADVAVVIVTYNSAADIVALIDDLRASQTDRSLRVIVVDNQSCDGTPDMVRGLPDVHLIESGGNLGYAGGINAGLPHAEPCAAVLVLNPDLRVTPTAVDRLFDALIVDPAVGLVVPQILEMDGEPYPSLRHEPSVTRALGDAIFGRKLWLTRPASLSEFDYRPASYQHSHEVAWATGAALLIRSDVVRRVGEWNEEFFLYSEETEYFRRVRDLGYRVRYEPSAVVRHRLGGTGAPPALRALLEVNRVRYIALFHGAWYSRIFRTAVAFGAALRAYNPVQRRILAVVTSRRRWAGLPSASKAIAVQDISGAAARGAVIIPAYNEAAVIEQTLAPLSQAAVEGFIELIVVCNGCTDDTAERARRVPGTHVVELAVGSKPLALNTGDDVATLWPRLYLDADIQITAEAVLAVLDRLTEGDVYAARPTFRYGLTDANAVVRSYYRARVGTALQENALWAGVYGLNEEGHARFGAFPDVIADDLFVDNQFGSAEKAVVPTAPSVWTTPTNLRGLLMVLRRHHRGTTELSRDLECADRTERATARAILGTIRGPRSAIDAGVYIAVALATRLIARRGEVHWDRDDSSRQRGDTVESTG